MGGPQRHGPPSVKQDVPGLLLCGLWMEPHARSGFGFRLSGDLTFSDYGLGARKLQTGLLRFCWWFQAVSPLCLLVLLVKGEGEGGGVLLLGVRDRGERMTPRTAAPRFEVVPSLGCVVLPRIPFWNATSRSIFSEDTECFGGFNLTPRRFYEFFPFLWFVFDILELLNADNKIWKPLNTWVVSQRDKGSVFSVWWRMQKVMAWKSADGASCHTHALTFKHQWVRIKTNNRYSRHINALTGSKRHGWKEQTREKIFHIRHLRKQKCINEWETVGRRWGSRHAFNYQRYFYIWWFVFLFFFCCVFLFQARWWFMEEGCSVSCIQLFKLKLRRVWEND